MDTDASSTSTLAEAVSSPSLSAAALNDTDGPVSLSAMVYAWVVVPPRVPFDGLLRVTRTVSSGSSRVSLVIVTGMEPAVSPGLKIRVPESRVKSVPEGRAVPPLTA